MRLKVAISLVLVLTASVPGCSDEGSKKKAVNETCQSNSDCADDICNHGICGSASPGDLGQPCSGHGECRSFVCAANVCAPGTRATGDGCLYNEECVSLSCVSNKCAAGRLDGGPDFAAPDGGPDLSGADLSPDLQPDAGPDLLAPDAPILTRPRRTRLYRTLPRPPPPCRTPPPAHAPG